MRKLPFLFVIAGAAWIAGAVVIAQGPPAGAGGGAPQAPMKLEVLPKTWSRQQVGALMQTGMSVPWRPW